MLLLLPLAEAGAVAVSGSTERVSVASDGTEANGTTIASTISDDGRYTVFASIADNLVPGDLNPGFDVFVHDSDTGTTELVSVDSNGAQGFGFLSFGVDISANGRWVAFDSDASNLVPDDTNGQIDVFVHDRDTGATERVSVSSDGTEGNLFSSEPSISADGRFVTFYSAADNLVAGDTNEDNDVFVHDRDTGETVRVSVASDGSEVDGDSSQPVISGNGRYVAFHSSATDLVADDTSQLLDAFVHDLQTGVTERVSVASDGSEGNEPSSDIGISGDGRYVTFSSFSDNFVPGDTNEQRDVFVHDRDTGTTERVSVASDTTEANHNSSNGVISADGQYVAFSSNADNLVPGDTNDENDIFVHNRQTGATQRVSVASDGTEANDQSNGPAISADGRRVVFRAAADSLVSGDTNELDDVFVRDRSDLVSSPEPLDFSRVLTGNSRGPLGVTVSNTMVTQTTVTSVTAPAAPFSADGGSCDPVPFTLDLGESCELTFSFSPGAIGISASEVSLTTDTPGSTHTFSLQGEGVSQALSIAPEILDFGQSVPEDTAGPMSVTLSNASSAPVQVSALDSPDDPFGDAGGSCGAAPFTLAAFESCTLDYTFNPPHVDVFSEVVALTHDAPSGPGSFTLQGEGLSRVLSVTPQLLAFGNQPLGEIGGPLSVTLTSEGLEDVSLDGISEPDGPFEAVGNTCGSVLASGESCVLTYIFTPSGEVSSLADVTIENDAQANPHTITLFGAGVVNNTELVSRADGASGAKADGSGSAVVSDDGSRIAFVTSSTLDPHDINGRGDVYLRDTRTKETILISRASGSDGTGGDWGSGHPAISADGRFVAYRSGSTNLHPDDNDQDLDVLVRDTVTQETILVSRAAGANGVKGDGWSRLPSLSADGRYVAFTSDATNLHPDDTVAEKLKVFVRDMQTDELFLVSRAEGAAGEAANDGSLRPSISADGRFVAFESGATNLHPDDDDSHGDIIVRDLQTHENILVSRASGADGVKANVGGFDPSISADGQRVAFETQSDNLDPDDPPGQVSFDVYVRDLVTHETILASRASGEDGVRCDPFTEPNNSLEASISADGRWVAFESVCWHFYPGDAGDVDDDVFVRDLATHTTHLASRASGASGEQGDDSSWAPSISGNGRFVSFYSRATNLNPDDSDSAIDVFVRDLLGSAGPQVAIDPASVGFGVLVGDGQSVTEVVTVTNPGNGVLEITGVVPPVSPFGLIGGTCGGSPSLGGGESCTFELEFSPSAIGSYEDTLVLTTNASPSEYAVPVYGERISDAEIAVDPGALTATLAPDDISEEILTIGNQGLSDALQWLVTEDAITTAGTVVRPSATVTEVRHHNVASDSDGSSAGGSAPAPSPSGNAPNEQPSPDAISDFAPHAVATTMTHSVASDIIAGIAAACPASAGNKILRTFTLTDFGIHNDFDVTEVTFGIEQLGATASITVNLYTLEGEFIYDNMRLIGSATQEFGPQQLTEVSIPVTANVAAGATLVVEIEVPGGQSFWPGANRWGESAPSYIALRPDDFLCAPFEEREPVAYGDVGIAANVVMAVSGLTEPLDCTLPSWASVSPLSGTLAPQSNEPATVTLDGSGLTEGEYGGFLCLDSNDPQHPQIPVPINLEVAADAVPAELAVSPASLGFGEVAVGATNTASLTVSNAAASGGDSLEISGIELLSGSPEFEWVGGDCQIGTELLAGESCSVDVQFEPPTQAFHTGALRVQASDGQSISVGLSGIGADAGAADVIFSDDFNQ